MWGGNHGALHRVEPIVADELTRVAQHRRQVGVGQHEPAHLLRRRNEPQGDSSDHRNLAEARTDRVEQVGVLTG